MLHIFKLSILVPTSLLNSNFSDLFDLFSIISNILLKKFSYKEFSKPLTDRKEKETNDKIINKSKLKNKLKSENKKRNMYIAYFKETSKYRENIRCYKRK